VVQTLLGFNADVNVADQNSGRTPLTFAAEAGNTNLIRLLLHENAAVDTTDSSGMTALLYALVAGQPEVASLLLAQGANTETPDSRGRTPLSYAADAGLSGIVQELLGRGAAPSRADKDGRNPLSYAAGSGRTEIVQILLAQPTVNVESLDKTSTSSLSHAVFSECVEAVHLLLLHGARAESFDDQGRSPLSYAAENGNQELVQALLEHGASPDAKDENCRSPLSYAVEYEHENVVDLFLAHTQDRDLGEALHLTSDDTIIRLLLDHGASPYSICYGTGSYCPLAFAAERGQEGILRIFLQCGGAENEAVKRKQCDSALSCATSEAQLSTVRILVEEGIFPEKDECLRRALSIARMYEHNDLADYLESSLV
jgi:ankyrin repeat protein